MNPFDKKPEQKQAAAAAPTTGYNPFAGADQVSERTPKLQSGVEARVRLKAYRVVDRNDFSGTAIWIDVEMVDVFKGTAQPGQILAHKITGFESSGKDKAFQAMNSLSKAIFAGEYPEGLAASAAPAHISSNIEKYEGREFFIRTFDHTTKRKDDHGNTIVIVKGEYQAA